MQVIYIYIVQVKYIDTEEAKSYMWYKRPVSFTLDDETRLMVQADDEGNDGGALFMNNEEGCMPVMRER